MRETDSDFEFNVSNLPMHIKGLVDRASKLAGIPPDKGMKFAVVMTALLETYRQDQARTVVTPTRWVM